MSNKAEVDKTSPKRCLQTYAQGTLLGALAAGPNKAEVDKTSPQRCLQIYAQGTLLEAQAAGSNRCLRTYAQGTLLEALAQCRPNQNLIRPLPLEARILRAGAQFWRPWLSVGPTRT